MSDVSHGHLHPCPTTASLASTRGPLTHGLVGNTYAVQACQASGARLSPQPLKVMAALFVSLANVSGWAVQTMHERASQLPSVFQTASGSGHAVDGIGAGLDAVSPPPHAGLLSSSRSMAVLPPAEPSSRRAPTTVRMAMCPATHHHHRLHINARLVLTCGRLSPYLGLRQDPTPAPDLSS